MIVVDELSLAEPRTKLLIAKLRETRRGGRADRDARARRNLELAGRNLPHVRVLPVMGLNVRDVLLRKHLVITRVRARSGGGEAVMKDLRQVIQRPVITEKSTIEREQQNIVTFAVHPDANKNEIRARSSSSST